MPPRSTRLPRRLPHGSLACVYREGRSFGGLDSCLPRLGVSQSAWLIVDSARSLGAAISPGGKAAAVKVLDLLALVRAQAGDAYAPFRHAVKLRRLPRLRRHTA